MKPVDIFMFVENFKMLMNGRKPIKARSAGFKLDRGSPAIKSKVVVIYNQLNCSHYKWEDFKCYVYNYYIFNKSTFWYNHNSKDIEGSQERLFSKNRLKKDQSLLLELNNIIKFTINDYLIIQESGECYMLKLLDTKQISPALYLNLSDKIKEEEKQSNKRQEYVNKVIKIIKELEYGTSKNI